MKRTEQAVDPHEYAAEAFLQRRSGRWSEDQEGRLRSWLKASDENRECFAEVERSWDMAGEAAASEGVRSLRAEALAARPQRDGGAVRRRWALAAGLALVIGAGLAGSLVVNEARGPGDAARPRTYRTALGERATITLADGSKVALNTSSAVVVDYRRDRRGLTLVSGEAWFDVAKDRSRPFVVSAGDHTVTAVGTSFDVRMEPSGLRVAVVEGRVAVGALGRGHLSDVSAGERMDVIGEAAFVRASGPVAGDWREGRLEFDSATLGQAVAEMNRYRRKPIVIADPSVERLKVSGVFYSGENSGFLNALPLTHPVRVRTTEREVRIEAAPVKKTSSSG